MYGISKTAKNLETLKQESGGKIQTICQDLSDWKGLRAVLDSLPVMNGLVNNAGIAQHAPVLEITEDQIDNVFNVNMKSVINVTQSVAKKMIASDSKTGFSIVNVSSQAGLVAIEDHLVYGATKAGLDQMTRIMALEFGKHNVRI